MTAMQAMDFEMGLFLLINLRKHKKSKSLFFLSLCQNVCQLNSGKILSKRTYYEGLVLILFNTCAVLLMNFRKSRLFHIYLRE